MAAKPNPRKKNRSAFSEARQGGPPKDSAQPSDAKQGPRWFLVGLFVLIVFGGGTLAMIFKDIRSWNSAMSGVEQYTYKVKNKYPHDTDAFTQGLFFHQGKLYESTGKYKKSKMRIVDIESGKPVSQELNVSLKDHQFGEGACVHKGKIYQLTWKEGECLVYDLDLNLLDTLNYEGEGWGLCSDGENLIMSDGTANLTYIDANDFSVIKKTKVRLGNRAVSQLNELEFFRGHIYANQLHRDMIFEIKADTGKVTAVVNLSGLWPVKERPQEGVLNGIAHNPDSKSLSVFVTGKYCPYLYEIEFVRAEQ